MAEIYPGIEQKMGFLEPIQNETPIITLPNGSEPVLSGSSDPLSDGFL